MKKVLLVLNGPMCAGKSTVASELMKKDNFFLGSYDKIKWLISNYTRENPEHRRMGREITFQAISGAVNQGLSVLIDGGHHEYRSRYKEITEKYDFKYVSVNIEAPYEVLKQRFLERVESARKIDRPSISVTNIEDFDAMHHWYLTKNKDTEAVTLHSHELNLGQIIAEIEKIVEGNR